MVPVVSRVCGIHAQVMGAAELSIRARLSGMNQADLRSELYEHRSLVKTYGPRSTLHLLPADELPLWMAALRRLFELQHTHWYESTGWKPKQAEAVVQAIGEALDGRCLLREELAREVVKRTGPWAEKPLASMWGNPASGWAAYTGRLCFGPPRGSKVTFVRADQWTGQWKEVDPARALTEVCRRYLAAFGPARPQDFAEWFRVQPADARTLFQTLMDELEEVDVEGRRAWRLATDDSRVASSATSMLRLIPQYDTYIMGCRERDRFIPEQARARIAAHPRGRFEGPAAMAWVLVDGIVVGTWERRKHGKRIELQVVPFVRLTRVLRRQLEDEADRVGKFLGSPVDLQLEQTAE